MSEIIDNEITLNHLAEWHAMAEELRLLKIKEILLRKRLFEHYFKTPVEGINTYSLENNYALKAKYPYSRSIDIAMYTAHKETLEKESKINVDDDCCR